LLAVVTLACAVLFGWRMLIRPYQVQRQWMNKFSRIGATCQTRAGGNPLLRIVMGDELFQDIIQLDVSDCDDPNLYLAQVERLPHLSTLTVGGSEFTDNHLQRLRELDSLRVLALDSTSVSDEAIALLKPQLPSLTVHRSYRRTLETIEKLGGKVTDYPSDGGSKTATLSILGPGHFRLARRVDLSGLYLEEDSLRPIADLPRLETLHLGYNIEDRAATLLVSLANLRHLYLKDTQITDDGLAPLASLTRLRLLSLGRNISDDGLAQIAAMKSLVYVDLEATQVTDGGLKHLAALPNLEKLNLSGRPISDDGLRQLQGITTLNELHLRGCKEITDDGFLSMREMENLKSVDLRRTNIGTACPAQLREALPNCTFKQ